MASALGISYIYGVFQCVVQPFTIVANFLIILAFVKIRSLQTHTSNLLIYALSVTDFVCGIMYLSGGAPMLGLGYPFGEIGCMVLVFLGYIYYIGNFILVAISVDRVLMVTLDYSQYVKIVTKLRINVTIALCILISFVAAVFEIMLWNYSKKNNVIASGINYDKICLSPPRRLKWFSTYHSVCFFILPVMLVGFFSVVFVYCLWARLRKNRRIGINATSTTGASSSVANSQHQSLATGSEPVNTVKDGTHVKKRYLKSAVTLAALVLSMSITMLPYCIYTVYVAMSGDINPRMTYIMIMVLQVNPLLDAIFYAATQKSIKEFYLNNIRAIVRKFTAFA